MLYVSSVGKQLPVLAYMRCYGLRLLRKGLGVMKTIIDKLIDEKIGFKYIPRYELCYHDDDYELGIGEPYHTPAIKIDMTWETITDEELIALIDDEDYPIAHVDKFIVIALGGI